MFSLLFEFSAGHISENQNNLEITILKKNLYYEQDALNIVLYPQALTIYRIYGNILRDYLNRVPKLYLQHFKYCIFY